MGEKKVRWKRGATDAYTEVDDRRLVRVAKARPGTLEATTLRPWSAEMDIGSWRVKRWFASERVARREGIAMARRLNAAKV